MEMQKMSFSAWKKKEEWHECKNKKKSQMFPKAQTATFFIRVNNQNPIIVSIIFQTN